MEKEAGTGVSNGTMPVFRDLGSHDTMKIRRPSQPMRKVLSERKRFRVSSFRCQVS